MPLPVGGSCHVGYKKIGFEFVELGLTQLKKRHLTHLGAFCTIMKRQPIAVSKYLVQNALALSHLRHIPFKVSKYALWWWTDGTNWTHSPW